VIVHHITEDLGSTEDEGSKNTFRFKSISYTVSKRHFKNKLSAYDIQFTTQCCRNTGEETGNTRTKP